MLKLASLAVAVTLLAGPTNGAAQGFQPSHIPQGLCQTRPLALDIDQTAELEPTDCRFDQVCNDCRADAPGEYWTVDAAAGDVILLRTRSTYARALLMRIVDATGRSVDARWAGSCDGWWDVPQRVCEGLWFKAEASGTYRAQVVEDGYMTLRFGPYTIRAQRVTTIVPGAVLPTTNGNRVSIQSYPHLSPTPILEYAFEAGSVSGASDIGIVSLSTASALECRCLFFESVASGTYFVRMRARS